MSRTIFVALCAVAILAMAPFVVAGEDNVPPNPVTDAHRELTIGMTPAEWQPIVENHLGWTKPEKSEYFAEGSTERRVMWTWDAQTKGGPNEPQWHFHLDVVFVEDVIRSTMYFAEGTRSPREAAKSADPKPTDPPHTELDDAYVKLKIGMTEDEAFTAVKSCVEWEPKIRTYDEEHPVTKAVIHCKDVWWRGQWLIGSDDPHGDVWDIQLCLLFADGKLYDADRIRWHRTHFDQLWSPPPTPEKK